MQAQRRVLSLEAAAVVDRDPARDDLVERLGACGRHAKLRACVDRAGRKRLYC